MRDGENIGVFTILEDFVSAIMKERKGVPSFKKVPGEEANGSYSRMLRYAMEKLNMKISGVRIVNSFPQVLPPGKWKRVDKRYKNPLLALLTNGYSQTQTERGIINALNLPILKERIEELTEMIHERSEVF